MKRIICLITSVFLIFQISFMSFAEETNEEPSVVHIKTKEDLINFSQKCTLDSFSENLIVYLDNDIDLLSVPFYPIPTFSGFFEGNNHKIFNFELATDGSHQGFFRYIQNNGIVQNLSIEGNVEPDSSMCQVGGVAGVNYGTLINCSFNGKVVGLNYIGGIAGVNYGIIDSCTSYGKVQGKRFTGGICGLVESNSQIISCVNNANVNTEITEGGFDLDKVNVSNALQSLNLVSVENKDVVADTGGISGNNLGNIISCENRGIIGYPHYGYNVGGIAGRQSGYLYNCSNNAAVYGKNDVAGIVGQMEPFLILKDRTTITDAINSLTSTTGYALNRLRENSSQYTGEIEAATYSIQTVYDTAQQYYEETDPDLKNQYLEEMKLGLQSSLTALQEIGPKLQNTVDYATVDFQNVNTSTYVVLNMLSAALSGNTVTNIYNDTSNAHDENDTRGRVSNNVNNGQIQADKNVGGIAGNVSIELDFDMEGSLLEIFQDKLDVGIEASEYDSKTVCINNINNGEISSKKDYCGGIVGYHDIGIVFNCDNYANVCSLQGFCGGIAGRSNAKIEQCHAMCGLEANEYVGGVAGYGSSILNCATLVKMNNATAAFGAIAGYAINFNEDNFGGNKFVSDTLGAIDGISYDGLAQAETFDAFKIDSNIPDRMKKLTITFIADSKVVKVVPFEYGGSINENQIPNVPEKNGYIGEWEDFKKNNLVYSTSVDAQYTSNIGAVASFETRDNSQLPIIVIDGEFDASADIKLIPYSVSVFPNTNTNDVLLESFTSVIDSELINTNKDYSIRYLPPKIDEKIYSYKLYVLENSEWKEISYQTIGSYIEFKGNSNTTTICIYSHKNINTLYFAITAVFLLAVIVLVFVLKNKRNQSHVSSNNSNLNDNNDNDIINDNVSSSNVIDSHLNTSDSVSSNVNNSNYIETTEDEM